jgi:hypothetical protein
MSIGLANTTATLGSFYWLGFETSGLSLDKKRLAWLGAQRLSPTANLADRLAAFVFHYGRDMVALFGRQRIIRLGWLSFMANNHGKSFENLGTNHSLCPRPFVGQARLGYLWIGQHQDPPAFGIPGS